MFVAIARTNEVKSYMRTPPFFCLSGGGNPISISHFSKCVEVSDVLKELQQIAVKCRELAHTRFFCKNVNKPSEEEKMQNRPLRG